MSTLAERDAAAAEFGFATQRFMAVVGRLNNDELSTVVTDLFNGFAHYLEAQDAHFAALAEEVQQRLASR